MAPRDLIYFHSCLHIMANSASLYSARHTATPLRQLYFKIPMWTTNPEPDFSSSMSSSSGTRQTWNGLLNTLSHDSNTSADRSCCATMQTVGFWLSTELVERNLHASTQVWTNGSIRASLYMQSHAITASKLWQDSDPVNEDATSSVSQSRVWVRILGSCISADAAADPLFSFALLFRPLFEDTAR